MYPDVLNLYGDRGNILCLCQRLSWRGIQYEVTRLPIGSSAPLSQFDLIFIGGGQDFEQQVLLEDLHNGKDKDIFSAVQDGLPFLTICGGYQLLGNYYETYDGQRCDFIGAVDLNPAYIEIIRGDRRDRRRIMEPKIRSHLIYIEEHRI